jgi:CDP-6-deoxy-D-xylo-4-hexulose-3-dehydrase
LGYNFKSTEMNAAFGLAQLRKLETFQQKRRDNVALYVQLLKELEPFGLILPRNHDKVDWLALPLMIPNRKSLLQQLESSAIQTRVCFAGNVTRHPAYRQFLQPLPNADEIMRNGFLLGAHHGLDKQDIEYVCSVIKSHIRNTLAPCTD